MSARSSTPRRVTGDNYTVTFSVSATVPPVTTYDVVNTTTAPPPSPPAQPYTDGQAIQFDGLSFMVAGRCRPTATPLAVAPSTRTDLFAVIDQAIAGINGAGNGHR